MLQPLGRHRRIVGRSQNARLYRDPSTCSCFRTQPHALLAGAAGWPCEFKRRQDALANRKRAVAEKRVRPARARPIGLGCRAVPSARTAARLLPDRA